METQTQRLMPAKAVKDEGLGQYEYGYIDGYVVGVRRSEDYPEQITIKVYAPGFNVISEMLVWAREGKKE